MDISEIERLTRLLRETPEVGSIEVRGWFGRGVVITRYGSGGMMMPAPVMMPAPTAPGHAPHPPAGVVPAATPERSAPAATNLKEIKSPMVGTFYMAPEPGAEAYAKVGTRVSPGQTVCIIEAMKIMNEIEAEVGGVIREVCVEDAQPVEFGQVLYRVDPNG
ncbi:MAG TPA: acetyl-CoA carboxylase biotin carboxyl carrier protein [Gemmatimonadales bacterium]|nr:acetyl-CoA carboxylase biotin carboxyl carrier protein [Gemmatimonadales bacterium]